MDEELIFLEETEENLFSSSLEGGDVAVPPPEAVALGKLLPLMEVERFARSIADLTQMECSVVLYDPAKARPLRADMDIQIVHAPICKLLRRVRCNEESCCIMAVHHAAHKAMKAGEAVTADCVGGEGVLYACPIVLRYKGRPYPKAAIVAAAHDIYRFHFADRLAEITGVSEIEVGDILCKTDRRCLNAAQLRDIRSIMETQARAFSEQISERYVELVSISTIVEQKKEIDRAYEALDQEVRVVGEIQRSLVPSEPPAIEGFDVAAFYEPAHRAGGDYFDFFRQQDGTWSFIVADVSGHGPPAAVVMTMMRTVLHVFHDSLSAPDDMLRRLNNYLIETAVAGDFITALCGRLRPEESIVEIASAGHNPPLFYIAKKATVVEADVSPTFPIMLSRDMRPTVKEFRLQSEDVLFVYTDGITDARNPEGKMFERENLKKSLVRHGRKRAEMVRDGLLADLEDFTQGYPADDDRTLLVLRKR